MKSNYLKSKNIITTLDSIFPPDKYNPYQIKEEDLKELLNNSLFLQHKLAKLLKNGLTDREFAEITNPLHYSLITIFMKQNNLEIIIDDEERKIDESLRILTILKKELDQYPTPTAKEEYELFKRLEQGDEKVRQEIIARNMRLVIKAAHSKSAYPEEELEYIQEGSLGLIRAVDKFKLSKRCRFSTYATPWIYQFINRCVCHQFSVNIPDKIRRKTRLFIERYIDEYYAFPSLEEIAQHIEIPLNECYNYLNAIQGFYNINEEYLAIYGDNIYFEMLEKNDSDEEDLLLLETIETKNNLTPEEEAIGNINRQKLLSFLKIVLSEREYEAVTWYHGFIDGIPYNKEDIAKRMGIRSQTTGRLIKKAHEKLQNYEEQILSFKL